MMLQKSFHWPRLYISFKAQEALHDTNSRDHDGNIPLIRKPETNEKITDTAVLYLVTTPFLYFLLSLWPFVYVLICLCL